MFPMDSRERVLAVLRGEKPDRVPVYGWVVANLSEQINERFGSVAAFEDHYEFDFAHLFGGPPTWEPGPLHEMNQAHPMGIEPAQALELPVHDPDDSAGYDNLREQVRHHKEERGRWVYVQTPGIFEALNGVFGIQNHLLYLMMYPDELREVYKRQAEWNRAFALNCLDIGIDQIHVSDDWGAQTSLMFSMDTWRDLIYPAHKVTCDAVKGRGGWLSLHSDGNVKDALDGIVELGYDVVHPWQVSAGMDYDTYFAGYRDKFALMGGLDVQTTIGFQNFDRLEREIREVLGRFRDGGLLFCTSHFVQDHCTMEELTFAYDLVLQLVREQQGS
jgi:uroporphyrinogen decarboxylase